MIFMLHVAFVEGPLIVMVIVVFALIVVSVLVVALSVSFSVSLRHRGACCEQEYIPNTADIHFVAVMVTSSEGG